jgi:hypothetical protein
MGVFSRFRTHVAKPVRNVVVPEIARSRGLRRGMWVVAQGQVGILVGLDYEEGVGAVARVQLVDENGENKMHFLELPNDQKIHTDLVIKEDSSRVIQATLNQIPAKRRPDRDVAARFGYSP